jgi:hypothetical protein
MKKILLLIVSGLLIAGMAGMAMAGADIQPSSLDVNINPNTAIADSFNVVLTSQPTGTYTLKVDPQVPGISVYVAPDIANQPLSLIPGIGSNSNWITSTSLDSNKKASMTIASMPSTQKGTLYIKGNTAGDVILTLYYNDAQVDREVFKAGVTVTTSVPEFPTVAFPVAAILGLIFIFGRKRGDL